MRIRTRGLVAALLLPTLVIAGTGLVAAPAYAASPGPGYDYQGDPASHLGGFRDPDGTISYCIDAAKPSPAGRATTDAGVVGRVNGRSESTMLQLSYVLMKYGNTSSDDQAAAVALVVWGLADPADHVARGGDDFVITRAPADHRERILALAARFRREAADYERPAPGEARLELTVDPQDPGRATLKVSITPSSATGAVRLSNAQFADTSDTRRRDLVDGAALPIQTLPPEGVSQFDVGVRGEFEADAYADGSVHLYTTPGAQSIASSGRRATVGFTASTSVTIVIPPPPAPEPEPTPTPTPRPLPRVAG